MFSSRFLQGLETGEDPKQRKCTIMKALRKRTVSPVAATTEGFRVFSQVDRMMFSIASRLSRLYLSTIEFSARTLGVMDVDGKKERFNMKNTPTARTGEYSLRNTARFSSRTIYSRHAARGATLAETRAGEKTIFEHYVRH